MCITFTAVTHIVHKAYLAEAEGNVTHFQIQVGEFFWNTPLPKSLGMEYATIF